MTLTDYIPEDDRKSIGDTANDNVDNRDRKRRVKKKIKCSEGSYVHGYDKGVGNCDGVFSGAVYIGDVQSMAGPNGVSIGERKSSIKK